MCAVINGEPEACPAFARVIDECLQAHGYTSEGAEGTGRPGEVNPADNGWDFIWRRTTVPADSRVLSARPCLDGADTTLVQELVQHLQEMLAVSRPWSPQMELKCGVAARVHLTYCALSYYTGLPVEDVGAAVSSGRMTLE